MKQKNTPDDAYSLIMNEIVQGSLKPGEVITEASLAEKYGLSRTPIREAFNRLQCEGLISTTNRTKRIYSLSIQDIKEIFEVKELIEGNVAWVAARNITDQQSEELEKIIVEMKKLRNVSPKDETEEKVYLERWLSLDRQFHGLLFKVAGNKKAQQIIVNLNLQWHRFKVGLAAMEGRIGYAIPEHESIARAIIAKNPEKARKEMVDHLENLKRYIIKLMTVFGYNN
ncbi:MAG: GntR family transcriptional regulator [Bacteroidales bacterium]